MKVLTFQEYDKIPYERIGFQNESKFISDMKKLNKRYFNLGNEDVGIFELYKDHLRCTNYVGFGVFDNVLIQVLPKVYEKKDTEKNMLVLLRLFDFAFNLNIKEWEINSLKQHLRKNPIFHEIITYLFAKHLMTEIERGMYREYTTYETIDTILRGKLRTSKEIRKLPNQYHIFNLERTIFNSNNLLNQILYYAVILGLKHTKWGMNRSMLNSIFEAMDEVSFRRISIDDIQRVKFNRLNQRFKDIFELAKIIIFGLSRSDESSRYGFFVDMNRLFEEHIFYVLKKNFNVWYQYPLGKPIVPFKDRERPDFIIFLSDKIIVLDAKYKSLESVSDIGIGDIRQIYTYLKIIQSTKSIGPINDAFLIYAGIQKKPEKTYEFFDGNNLHILTYDLRKILDRGYDVEFVEILKKI